MDVRGVRETSTEAKPFASHMRSMTSGFEVATLTVDGDGVVCVTSSSSGGVSLLDDLLGAGMV